MLVGTYATQNNCFNTVPSFHYKFCFFSSEIMCSDVRHAKAIIVHVGFLSPLNTNGPASTTYTLSTSWRRSYLLTTDVFGLYPFLLFQPHE